MHSVSIAPNAASELGNAQEVFIKGKEGREGGRMGGRREEEGAI